MFVMLRNLQENHTSRIQTNVNILACLRSLQGFHVRTPQRGLIVHMSLTPVSMRETVYDNTLTTVWKHSSAHFPPRPTSSCGRFTDL